MSNIYDLDNEYGGRIIGDGGESSTDGALSVKSGAATNPAMLLGKTKVSSSTVATLVFANLSRASGAVIDFGNNYISTASIGTGPVGYLGCAEKWVVVRAGGFNYGMPLFSLSTQVNGPGAY